MTDLSNFFAKKDKRKPKGIVKFATINEIEQKLSESDKKRALEKKYTDDEWNEYEEKLKDYSGLKIQNTISENDENNCSESGNTYEEKGSASCPWKVIENPGDKSFKTLTASSKKFEAKTLNSNVYIPPHLRNKETKNTHRNSKSSIDTNKIERKVLEINNREIFPSLSCAPTCNLGNKRKGKDTLKKTIVNGVVAPNSSSSQAPDISFNKKYVIAQRRLQ